jgi:hypothetical protein
LAGFRFCLNVVAFLPTFASTDLESKESCTKLSVTKRDVVVGANDFEVSVVIFGLDIISPKLLLASFALVFSASLIYRLGELNSSMSYFLKVLPVESDIMSKSYCESSKLN